MAPFLFGVMALAGCGGERATCSDTPLGGTCTRIDGTWLLEAGQRARCGEEVFDVPVSLRHVADGQLRGSAGRVEFFGVLFPDGVFQLFSSGEERHFSVQGQHVSPPGEPDELRGGVSYGAGDACDVSWQFIGHRQ